MNQRVKLLIGTVLIVSLIIVSASSWFNKAYAGSDLDAIRNAIEEKGLSWTVRESDISSLSLNEFQILLGSIDEDPFTGINESDGSLTPTTQSYGSDYSLTDCPVRDLPQSLDWRNYQGLNWVTEPKSQGSCGSCWAFGIVGAWESCILLERNEPIRSIDKSEQFVLSCSEGTCSGWSPAGAAGFIYTTGCPDEDCFPYGPPYDATPCDSACTDWQDTADTLNTGAYLSGFDVVPTTDEVAAIKTALLDGPIAASMSVYQDFQSYGGGIYEYAWGNYMADHCIVVIGWDDTSSPPCWICKNSWDTWWGEGGFFRIAIGESYSKIGMGAYEIGHSEPVSEYQLCVEDTLGNVGYGSSSPAVRYGGVEYTVSTEGRLTAIMTKFLGMNMSYTVSVFDGISSGVPGTLLTSETDSFDATLGWKRILLSNPVHVDAGSSIFVVVRYATIAYAVPLESLDSSYNNGDSWYSSNGSYFSNLTSYGDICIRAMVTTDSAAPPDTVEALEASAQGSDVQLTWSPVTADLLGNPTIIDYYIVYRDTFAQFDISAADSIGGPTGTSFTDYGAVGDYDTNFYYTVVVVDDFGTESARSKRVGEFDNELP